MYLKNQNVIYQTCTITKISTGRKRSLHSFDSFYNKKFEVDYTKVYFIALFLHLKGKFSSGREGALASKFNYDFK